MCLYFRAVWDATGNNKNWRLVTFLDSGSECRGFESSLPSQLNVIFTVSPPNWSMTDRKQTANNRGKGKAGLKRRAAAITSMGAECNGGISHIRYAYYRLDIIGDSVPIVVSQQTKGDLHYVRTRHLWAHVNGCLAQC